MRALIQRVTEARVAVDGRTVGEIGKGFLILLGVAPEDDEAVCARLAAKTVALRVFEDEAGKMNRALADVGGQALIVSQFTLCANCSHGRRPDFFGAAKPAAAEELYEYFCTRIKMCGVTEIGKGIFGADMQVELLNDGPVTIIIDSGDLKK